MDVDLQDARCVVERGDSPKVYSESLLLHQIKVALIDQGHDVIKKRMWKDGHLMGSDETQYIRERKWKFAIYDGMWAIRKLTTPYNAGTLILDVQRNA